MKRSIVALFAPVCLLLTSCTFVACKEPVGTPVKEGIAEKFDGTWQAAGSVMHVKFLGDGRVLVASISDEKEGFKLSQQTVIVTMIDKGMYANFPLPAEGKPQCYALARVAEGGGGNNPLVLYGPKFNVFSAAVEGGKLPGEVKKESEAVTSVTISDRAALEKFIRERPVSELFNVEEPLVLTRIGEPKKEKKSK